MFEREVMLELVGAIFRIRFDYEHRFAEHEHDFRHRSRIAHAYLERFSISRRSQKIVANRIAGVSYDRRSDRRL